VAAFTLNLKLNSDCTTVFDAGNKNNLGSIDVGKFSPSARPLLAFDPQPTEILHHLDGCVDLMVGAVQEFPRCDNLVMSNLSPGLSAYLMANQKRGDEAAGHTLGPGMLAPDDEKVRKARQDVSRATTIMLGKAATILTEFDKYVPIYISV
jgi:hypothetical protein